MSINLELLVRKNIWNLKPYSTARDEYQGEASVYLDANESPCNGPYDRYPDPRQWAVKEKIARIKGVRKEQIMLGNGSDEPIDLAVRIFCEPGMDNIVTIDPTYGMYKVAARTNNVELREVILNDRFDFQADDLLKATDGNTKLIFLCSPNNPTGNTLNRDEVVKTIQKFPGIVILDEAYIDFSAHPSFLKELDEYPNLVVLQTFSKAWASAGIRLGMAFASEEIIYFFNKVKYPYNINILTQDYISDLLDSPYKIINWTSEILAAKKVLQDQLKALSLVEKIYPSDTNFILVKVKDANATYHFLVDQGIIVRNRNTVSLCRNCLRITVGTPEENETLMTVLKRSNT